MSKQLQLTTEQIIRHVTNATIPGEWEWEVVLEQAVQDGWENAAAAARFLEKLHPGRTWSAAEYHGLMYHHTPVRWSSAAEIGYIRANEAFTDAFEEAGDDEQKRDLAKRVFAGRTASDEDAEKFIRSMTGTHIFECADGTVLTFDGIVNGVIREEEPA